MAADAFIGMSSLRYLDLRYNNLSTTWSSEAKFETAGSESENNTFHSTTNKIRNPGMTSMRLKTADQNADTMARNPSVTVQNLDRTAKNPGVTIRNSNITVRIPDTANQNPREYRRSQRAIRNKPSKINQFDRQENLHRKEEKFELQLPSGLESLLVSHNEIKHIKKMKCDTLKILDITDNLIENLLPQQVLEMTIFFLFATYYQ